MLEELIKSILLFREERDWGQFHTPENLAKSIVIEAAELLENFQWGPACDQEKVAEELADVIIYCILLSDCLKLDFYKIIENKLKENCKKYPIEKSKGNSKKYTEFE